MPPDSSPRSGRRPRPPLDPAKLDELALAYVGRFATSRAKLTNYLARKLRERGWGGERDPDIPAVAERLARLGYVDDAAYAVAKARAQRQHMLVAGGIGRGAVEQWTRIAAEVERGAGAIKRDR